MVRSPRLLFRSGCAAGEILGGTVGPCFRDPADVSALLLPDNAFASCLREALRFRAAEGCCIMRGRGREGRRVRFGIVAAALTSAVLVAGAAEVAAQATDVLTIGMVSVSSGTGQVEVPIYIQDNIGTPIGRDKGAGLRISNFAMQVAYGPNACIDTPASASQRIDLTGGILAGLTPDFESRVKVANSSQSWIYTLF